MNTTAKLFQSGRSQAVRLSKALRFEGEEGMARRFGNGVLSSPVDAPWQVIQGALGEFEPGFVLQHEQPVQQTREACLG